MVSFDTSEYPLGLRLWMFLFLLSLQWGESGAVNRQLKSGSYKRQKRMPCEFYKQFVHSNFWEFGSVADIKKLITGRNLNWSSGRFCFESEQKRWFALPSSARFHVCHPVSLSTYLSVVSLCEFCLSPVAAETYQRRARQTHLLRIKWWPDNHIFTEVHLENQAQMVKAFKQNLFITAQHPQWDMANHRFLGWISRVPCRFLSSKWKGYGSVYRFWLFSGYALTQ